jgi:tripartite-type tricarboxylate transporter receptor subunit TctC
MNKGLGALILLTCLAGGAPAQAQSYPTRTITLTVTAAAGGVTDVVARALGQRLAETWGQQVVIENKGGAAHVVGAQSVAKAAPDGYSLLVAEAGTFTINPTLYGKGKLPYDEEKDFIPITGIVRINQALLAHPSLPAKTVRELIELASKKPGELTYGTAGIGSAPHMNMVLFESMAGVKLVPVHYRGAAPALSDVIAGHVNLMSVSVSLALPPFRSGQIKIFGIGSSKRLPPAADIPTVAENGLPGYEATTWFGLFATRRNAAWNRGQDQRRDREDFGRCAIPRKIPGAADVRADGELAGTVRRLHQGPDPQMGRSDPRAEAFHRQVALRASGPIP